jgi:TonB-dependent SusC/RagA subfamily outer membrane receptor
MKKHLYSKHGTLLTIMRVTFYQLMCIFFLSAMAYAHHTPAQELLNRGVTLSFQEVSLKEALNQIESKTKVRFAYNRSLISSARPITISFKNEKLSFVLERLLFPLGINYQVFGDQILLSKRKVLGLEQNDTEIPEISAPGKVALPVKGRVSDSDSNEGLPGVSVVVKGTSTGTITNVNGTFELDVPNGQSILVFSYVGYILQEVAVDNSSNLNIKLIADTKALEEVVVIGYGTQKKRDLTGAVSSIDNTKNETLPNTNVIQALRGTVPGVNISAGGNAGSGNEISIRGQNSLTANNAALIVVDGIIYSGQLGNLNPNDIASIDVLKDASSAAIFGAKAANGVILITTKKGTTEKPTIQFNSYAGTQDFLMSMDMETPEQYIQKRLNYQKTLAYRGVAPQPNLANPAQYLNADEIDNYENGRTSDAIERISQRAPIQSYNLNIGAKTARTSYYVAGSWTDQQGKVVGDQFKRASLRLNLETNITDWLSSEPILLLLLWTFPTLLPI